MGEADGAHLDWFDWLGLAGEVGAFGVCQRLEKQNVESLAGLKDSGEARFSVPADVLRSPSYRPDVCPKPLRIWIAKITQNFGLGVIKGPTWIHGR